ncbi:NADH-quinone oxidoreductase subunit NuoH, partial [Methylococcus sp. S2T]
MTVGSPAVVIGILLSTVIVAAWLIWVERRMIGIWQDRL